MKWTIPEIDGLLAAFHVSGNGLVPVDEKSNFAPFHPQAKQTQAIWTAASSQADAATLIVSSDETTSVALRGGGLVVAGRAKLNVGLLRLSARHLPVQDDASHSDPHGAPGTTRFRRILWQILLRLNEAQLPRVYRFDFGGVTVDALCKGGQIRFGGDIATAAAFVSSIRTACDSEAAVAYTIVDMHDNFGDEITSAAGILCNAVDVSDGTDAEFDQDGWPLVCSKTLDFGKLQMLSDISVAACEMCDEVGSLKLKVLTRDNAVVFSGRTTDDRTLAFSH